MRKFVLPIIFIMIAVVYSSIVVVTEGTRGIMLRFGKVQRDVDNKVAIYTPGLHFKIPFIDNIKVLDARLQTLDGQADRFVTVEKKDLLVDSYVKWRINDFGRFFTSTGGGGGNTGTPFFYSKCLMCELSKLTCRMKSLLPFINGCVQNVMQLLVNTVRKVKKKPHLFKQTWIVK